MNLTERFIKSLPQYNITYEEIIKCHYVGNDTPTGITYFRMCFPDLERQIPEHHTSCICKQAIKNNHYIADENNINIYVLGSCCIKKFINTGLSKTCSICKAIHRNRKDNLCKYCRKNKSDNIIISEDVISIMKIKEDMIKEDIIKEDIKIEDTDIYNICHRCNKNKVKKPFINCYDCNNKHKIEQSHQYKKCISCDKLVHKKYNKCWNCKDSEHHRYTS